MRLAYGENAGTTADLIRRAEGAPALIVFVNGANRPAARVTRALINYAEMRRSSGLVAGIVWLAEDRSAAAQYLERAVSWWGVNSPVGISLDGGEGPGAYGINRQVNLTVLVAKERRVTANFALVQPSPTDVPKILGELTKLIGGDVPSQSVLEFLSTPTRKLGTVAWSSAPSDVELRARLCSFIEAARKPALLERAAATIETLVEAPGELSNARKTQLGEAAALLLRRRNAPPSYAKILRRWRERYGAADAKEGLVRMRARGATSVRVLRFDMGPDASPTRPGFLRVTAATLFDAQRGFGWLGDPADREAFHRTEISPQVIWGYEPSADVIAGVASTKDLNFKLTLPNGRYTIEVCLGDLGGFVPAGEGRFLDTGVRGEASGGPGGPLYSMAVASAKRVVARDIETRTYPQRGQAVSTALAKELGLPSRATVRVGNYRRIAFTEQVRGGELHLRFFGDETKYRQALAEFQGLDPIAMRQRAHRVGGPFTRNSVLSIVVRPAVVGSPSGSGPIEIDEDGVTLKAVVGTSAELERFISAFNGRDFARAEKAADALTVDSLRHRLERVVASSWLVGHVDLEEERRLLPRLLDELTALRRAVEEPSKNANSVLRAEVDSLRGRILDFDRGVRDFDQRTRAGQELVTCMNRAEGHFARALPGEPFYWKSQVYRARIWYSMDPNRRAMLWPKARQLMRQVEKIFPTNRRVLYYLQDDPSGWPVKEYTSEVRDAPDWAVALRAYYNRMLDLSEWWIRERQDSDTGALGGEWGDDVEFAPLIGYTAFICPDASPLAYEGAIRFGEGIWSRSGVVDTQNGFFHLTADAEHSAEFTGDVLGMMVHLQPGDPAWIERALKTAKLMRDVWTGRNEHGQRLFRSSFLGAFHVPQGETEVDSAICGRAILPALGVLEYNDNPEIRRLVLEMADTLIALSRSTEKGKPAGVLPGPIVYRSGELGSPGSSSWWRAPNGRFQGMFSFPRYHGFRHRILTTAWELTGDASYLDPIRREAELAESVSGKPSDAEPGSPEWTAAQLARIRVPSTWRDIERRLAGASIDSSDGTTAHALPDLIAVAAEARRLSKVARKRWPIMTDDATMTDRVAFGGCVNSTLWYCGARIEAQQVVPAVSYEHAGRNFAALVRHHDRRHVDLLYFGFDESDREIDIRLWELDPGASYRLTMGPDADGDGAIDKAEVERDFELAERGDSVSVRLPGRRTMAISIRQMRRRAARSPRADLAISSRDIRVDPRGHLLVDVHNIGNRAADNVTVAFHDGDPARGGQLLGKVIVSHLEPPNTLEPQIVRTGIEWRPSRKRHRITVVVDSENTVAEISEANNSASIVVE
jgi:hypothetical protein